MSYIYTRRREPKSIFYTSLLPKSERQETILWRIGGALVAQGGPGTFERYLRITIVVGIWLVKIHKIQFKDSFTRDK